VYIGPRCHIGLVTVEAGALLGAGVHALSGPRTHGTADPSVPIREQEGTLQRVRIGAGAWVGSCAVIMQDVGAGSVVGAGAVVTTPVPEKAVAGGVPARVLRELTRGADD
ncbi:MAG: acyltransferase, partial [Gemmataceae bacterium]